MGNVQRLPRLLSYSEIETALTCFARWDFSYGGRLAGSTLKSRHVAPILSEGRAWGAAVATWHREGGTLLSLWLAHEALKQSIDDDVAGMIKRGWPPPPIDEIAEMEARLGAMLDHYAATTEPLANVTRLEGEILVPLPSRSGKRTSNTYRFLCYVDAQVDDRGQLFIVEFKLRNRLTDPSLLVKQRQPRWYAWGHRQLTGVAPSGVIIDERLNEIPHHPNVNKGRVSKAHPNGNPTPSHAKDQLTTAEWYAEVCHEFGVMPELETMEALRARRWQQRFPLSFRPSELDQAGRELVSAAKLIRDLDNGTLEPIRNASQMHCNGCRFKSICAEPTDSMFVESNFERTTPKRLRPPHNPEEERAA
jgi:hypothetical protein